MFQQYPQSDVNEPIPLHEGRFRVWAGDRCVEGSGSAHLRWLPSPGIEFDLEITEPFPGVGFDSLTVELPGFRTENVVAHSMTLGSTSRIGAFASAMESDREQNLLSVGFQVVNFTDFITLGLSAVPGDPTATAGVTGTERLLGGVTPTGSPTKRVQSLTRATAGLRHDGWNVSLVAVPESGDRYRHLKATGGYSFTHVGQLTRIDDSAFAVQQAEKILESLRVFLSFARGAACSLPIRWGRGIDGEIVWRQFGSPIVDRWRQRLSWFDEIHGEVLTELFDAFCQGLCCNFRAATSGWTTFGKHRTGSPIMPSDNPFKWRQFEPALILQCVRWYLRYALSYRDLEDMMRERGLCVDHTTIYRWVQRYAPEIDKRCRPFLRRTNDSYRIDETYVRVAGAWTYLYRGVDSNGDTLDFLLRATRDRKAAIAFFRKTLGAAHTTPPRVVTVDKNPAYPVAFEAVRHEGLVRPRSNFANASI